MLWLADSERLGLWVSVSVGGGVTVKVWVVETLRDEDRLWDFVWLGLRLMLGVLAGVWVMEDVMLSVFDVEAVSAGVTVAVRVAEGEAVGAGVRVRLSVKLFVSVLGGVTVSDAVSLDVFRGVRVTDWVVVRVF